MLNVNIPKLPAEEIKGIKVCKQANAKWEENFDERVNPHGKKYYWLSGYFNNIISPKMLMKQLLVKDISRLFLLNLTLLPTNI